MGACLATLCCECSCAVGCCACKGCCNWTLGRAAKVGHIFLAAAIFTVAEILGWYFYDKLDSIPGVNLTGSCDDDYLSSCAAHQLIYRASAALLVSFVVLAGVTSCTPAPHTGWWPMKFTLSFGLFIAFWWGTNDGFATYANWARFLSIGWLMMQNLLCLDAAHDAHDHLTTKMTEEEARAAGGGAPSRNTYLFLALAFGAGGVVACGFMYNYYGSCAVNVLLITITLVAGALFTVASLLDSFNLGLLPPASLFAYSAFLNWYALQSANTEACNPSASNPESVAYVVSQAVSVGSIFAVLCYASWNTAVFVKALTGYDAGAEAAEAEGRRKMDAVLTGEDPNGRRRGAAARKAKAGDEAAAEGPGTPEEQQERATFHASLAAGAVFMAMALTDWGNTDGSPISSSDSWQSNASFWMKVGAQWTLLLMQARVLYVSYEAGPSS